MLRRVIEITGSDATLLTAMQYATAPSAITFQIGRGRYVTIANADARELAAWLIGHAVDSEQEPTLISQAAWAEGMAGIRAFCDRPNCGWFGTEVSSAHMHTG